MKLIGIEQLEAHGFYWGRRKPVPGAPATEPHDIEIVQISTVFGAASEFWTVAVIGADEHFSLENYEFFHKIPSPPVSTDMRAALALVPSMSRPISH